MEETNRAKFEEWLAVRKAEGLKIDPDTAEVYWCYAQVLDLYGIIGVTEDEVLCRAGLFRPQARERRLDVVR